jgi:mRNA interferase RelE/StbE
VGSYSLAVKKSAARELGDLPRRDCQRIVERIRALAKDPRPRGAEKLSGQERYRIRQGDYRILYEIDETIRAVTIVKLARSSLRHE